MGLLRNLLESIDKNFGVKTVSAHCDVPCGIYDPIIAQIDAHTVLRMTDLLSEEKTDKHKISRLTAIKEKHAENLKNEVRILWGDYFKEEHEKKYPELAGLIKKALQLGSKTRQNIDKKASTDLLNTVQEIAVIFWKTKGKEVQRVKPGYPTSSDLVLPK